MASRTFSKQEMGVLRSIINDYEHRQWLREQRKVWVRWLGSLIPLILAGYSGVQWFLGLLTHTPH